MPAEGEVTVALTACMAVPSLLDVRALSSSARAFAQQGAIDALGNLSATRVYLFSGQADATVLTPVVRGLAEQLQQLGVPRAHVALDTQLAAGHGIPTRAFGVRCGATAAPFLNNCAFDGVGAALNFTLGPAALAHGRAPHAGLNASFVKLVRASRSFGRFLHISALF